MDFIALSPHRLWILLAMGCLVLFGCPKRATVHPESLRQYQLGEVHFKEKEYDRAMMYYEKAREADKNHALPYDRLGTIAQMRGQAKNAVEMFRRAISKDRKNPMLWDHLGLAFFEQRRYKDARSAFEKSISLQASYFSGRLHLVRALRRLRSFSTARVHALRLLTENPRRHEPHYELGLLYVVENKETLAVQSLKRAIERKQVDVPSHFALGRLYLQMKQYRLSLQQLQIVLRLDQNHREALSLYGKANQALNK